MLSSVFIATLNHLLQTAGWARDRLAPHAGRSARLCVGPVRIVFSVANSGHLVEQADEDAAVDVVLTLPADALPAILRGGMETALKQVRIEGSAEFADALGFVFRNLRWDAEEDLARVIGDIPARRVSMGLKSLAEAQKRAFENVGSNLAEYFTEEQSMLLTRTQLARHTADVAALRDAVARLDKRIAKLD